MNNEEARRREILSLPAAGAFHAMQGIALAIAATVSSLRNRTENPRLAMRRACVFAVGVFVLGVLLEGFAQHAPSAPNRRFLVIYWKSESDLLAQLNEAADKGYRFLAGGPTAVLLEKVATPPDTYRYHLAGGEKARTHGISEDQLNQAGAAGYRLIPTFGWCVFVSAATTTKIIHSDWTTLTKVWLKLMEKEPHPRNYQYVYASEGTKKPGLSRQMVSSYPLGRAAKLTVAEAVQQGFRVVDWGPGGFIMERPAEGPSASEPLPTAGASLGFGSLNTFRTSSLQKKVTEMAEQGYRVFGSLPEHESAVGGGISLIMERAANPPDTYAYLFFGFHHAPRLQGELNSAGEKGFRLHPGTLGAKDFAMEKPPGPVRVYQYIVLKIEPVTELYPQLEKAAEQGYRVAGIAHQNVVLERSLEKGGS